MLNNKRVVLFFMLTFALLTVFSFLPSNTIAATTTESKATTSNPSEIQTIQKIIGDKTPSFISQPIIAVINFLEEFRKTNFNNPFIFYSILIILLILIIRFIWRLIF